LRHRRVCQMGASSLISLMILSLGLVAIWFSFDTCLLYHGLCGPYPAFSARPFRLLCFGRVKYAIWVGICVFAPILRDP
jgi:hypothetical protein